ncbi:MAG: hypothetical protein ACK47B_16960 [Armatimonadota bacterium]
MKEAESIRVRYDHRETGWAVALGEGLAMIDNVPLSPRCNLGDVVRLAPSGPDGLPGVADVVHQRFTAKTVLYYYGAEERQLLFSLLTVLGCAIEDARKPLDFTPGLLLVAHDRRICPDLLARAAGVPQPAGTPSRVALEGGTLVADAGHLRVERPDGSEVASWEQSEWTARPEVAVEVLDTLHRCLCRGAGAARQGLSEGENGPRSEGRGPALRERPLHARFRRWRSLG